MRVCNCCEINLKIDDVSSRGPRGWYFARARARETYGFPPSGLIRSATTMIVISQVDKRPGMNFRGAKHLGSAGRMRKTKLAFLHGVCPIPLPLLPVASGRSLDPEHD